MGALFTSPEAGSDAARRLELEDRARAEPTSTENATHPTLETLSEQAALLPPAERMELVECIYDELIESSPEQAAVWAGEAEDGLAACRRSEIDALQLAEVMAR